MRAVFSTLCLLIVAAVIGVLAKKQFSGLSVAPTSAPAEAGLVIPATTPGATPQQHSQQIQAQVKQSLEAAVQARPLPEDK
jgi:hypothetical protein